MGVPCVLQGSGCPRVRRGSGRGPGLAVGSDGDVYGWGYGGDATLGLESWRTSSCRGGTGDVCPSLNCCLSSSSGGLAGPGRKRVGGRGTNSGDPHPVRTGRILGAGEVWWFCLLPGPVVLKLGPRRYQSYLGHIAVGGSCGDGLSWSNQRSGFVRLDVARRRLAI